MNVTFSLVGEGTSDLNLVAPIESLLLRYGAESVEARPVDLSTVPDRVGHKVVEKVKWVVENDTNVDIIFVHRDADNAGYDKRYGEISDAFRDFASDFNWVPVIPVRTIEAWILVEEYEIRRVADNPNGRIDLDVPSVKDVESIKNPKEKLFDLLRQASEVSGRRLKKLNRSLGRCRSRLIDQLDVEGPVKELESWKTFEAYTKKACSKILDPRSWM